MINLEDFVEQLKKALGDNLQSIVLFGSKAAADSTVKASDNNILIVLKEAGFTALGNSSKTVQKWIKEGNSIPVIFTEQELKDSADVFPIEFIDMKDAHRVLFGSDVLFGLEISDKNLRHQCEYEIKTKLLKLRQGAILFSDNDKQLAQLMVDSFSSVLTVFKHTLKLAGKKPPLKKTEAIGELCELVAIKRDIFDKVLAFKNGDKNALGPNCCNALIQEYLNSIAKAADYINKL